MIYGESRNELRQHYFNVWQKMKLGKPLSIFESRLANVIDEHPEYHHILKDSLDSLELNFSPELNQSNPFLHMSLHVALKEQLQTNRPKGISLLIEKSYRHWGEPHRAEHILMEDLVESIWSSQKNQKPINEMDYLKLIKKTLKKHNIR